MNANDTIHGPPWTDRRARAARMLASGMSITRVSLELGLSPATARRYQTLFAAGGVASLMQLGDVGRRSKLSPEAQGRIARTVRSPPRLHGFASESWTRELVRQYIDREFGIRYSLSHINRLIRDLRLTVCVRSDAAGDRSEAVGRLS